MVREGVTQEVNVLASDFAGENMAILLLAATEELKRVGPKLQGTAQVRDEAIFNCRLPRLSVNTEKTTNYH